LLILISAMTIRNLVFVLLFPLSFFLLRPVAQEESKSENHLKNIRQLTFGGENAEAYFSFDGKKLIFQSTRDNWPCDQIYSMNNDGSDVHRVSTGKGRTTCSYFLKDGQHFIYSSTHLGGEACPPKPDYSRGYVWSLEEDYDIFLSDFSGKLKRLTTTPGYDAEATISPDGKRIVFTSVRDGDLELYSMKTDGSDVRRLTRTPGYDGGAFFSPDSKKIVYRAHHPTDDKSMARYKELLAQDLIEPRELDLFVMDADGSHSTQITSNHAANFCPFFHPSGKRIIFSSNVNDPKGRNFDLFLIDLDGSGLEQITFNETFDGFPMFSPDGKKLVFASNRNGKVRGETNVFIADWVE
jgi:TolB protein